MSNQLSVASLKLGDKFEFATEQAAGSKSAVMIVTRNPSVNMAAQSCHFRYQLDGAPTDSARGWDSQSWNGTPDAQVRIIRTIPPIEAPAEPIAPPTAPTASKPPKKPVTSKKSAPRKKAAPQKKTAGRKTAVVGKSATRAVKKTAAKAKRKRPAK